jgi:hypothetical protein
MRIHPMPPRKDTVGVSWTPRGTFRMLYTFRPFGNGPLSYRIEEMCPRSGGVLRSKTDKTKHNFPRPLGELISPRRYVYARNACTYWEIQSNVLFPVLSLFRVLAEGSDREIPVADIPGTNQHRPCIADHEHDVLPGREVLLVRRRFRQLPTAGSLNLTVRFGGPLYPLYPLLAAGRVWALDWNKSDLHRIELDGRVRSFELNLSEATRAGTTRSFAVHPTRSLLALVTASLDLVLIDMSKLDDDVWNVVAVIPLRPFTKIAFKHSESPPLLSFSPDGCTIAIRLADCVCFFDIES